MAFVTFDVDGFCKSWTAMQNRMDAAGSQAWRQAVQRAWDVQREYGYQNRTGKLTASMKWRTWEPTKFRYMGELTTTAPYAQFVDSGTRPHRIQAKGGGVLRFFWPKVGGWVAFKGVNHPGTKGAGFSAAAIQTFGQSAPQLVEQAISNAAQR